MPSSGRWMALFAGEFRRLRAASYFARGGSSSQSPLDSVSAWRRKLRSFPCSSSSRRTRCAGLHREQRWIGQNAAGDGSRWALRAHIRLSPDPRYGGYLLEQAESFRRAKSEWRSAVSPGPLGPGFTKIRIGAIPPPRLGLPNQRYRARIRDTSSVWPSASHLPLKGKAVGCHFRSLPL